MEYTKDAHLELREAMIEESMLEEIYKFLDERGSVFGAPQALVERFLISRQEAKMITEAWYGKNLERRSNPDT